MSETLKKQLQTLSGSYMEQLIRANRAEAENRKLQKRLREEFVVCYAAGYPDPMRFNNLEDARIFASKHRYNHSLRMAVTPVTPVIKRRQVSEWEDVE